MSVFPPLSILGLKVAVVKPQPKMQLSHDCPVTDDFRKEMNQWMIEFFGYQEPTYPPKGKGYMMGDTLLVHPEDYAEMQKMQGKLNMVRL